MKKTLTALLLLVFPAAVFAAGDGGVKLIDPKVDLSETDSLQRGARLFVNYCLSCHSAKYMRYSRMARDLGLTDRQVKENLMFTGEKIGDTMTVAMTEEDAKRWFGSPPPDLSVVARSRGPAWLYTYLLSFYRDDGPSRPYGVNNLVFEGVGMPNVLWELQGIQVPVWEEVEGPDGSITAHVKELKLKHEGTMSPAHFRFAMRDLVSFLVYLGEPAKLQRYSLGLWVLAFLAVLFFVSYLLKKEYWKDVH